MQDHLRYLVVDDVTEWANQLREAVADYFVGERHFAKVRVRGFSAYDATQADNHIAGGGWDLVLLDMNLGDGSQRTGARSRISGLDLLGDIARGNRAYFVIIVTGAVTDPHLENFYGKDTAALLRFGALNEAVRMMPASRVRILHKPEAQSVSASIALVRQQIHSALDQYCSVSLERNIFRALPQDPELLEICYNGGPRLTVPFDAPFRTIQSAFAQPNRMLRVTELIQKLAHSSVKGGPVLIEESHSLHKRNQKQDSDAQGPQDDEVSSTEGLAWDEMDGFSISSTIRQAADLPDGSIPIESLIGPLLSSRRRGVELQRVVECIIEQTAIDEAILLSIPQVAMKWAGNKYEAAGEFGVEDAAGELKRLVAELKPILEEIKHRWLARKRAEQGSVKQQGQSKGRKAVRVAKGIDTKEMILARQHWKRFIKKIKARPALADFHKHVVQWMPRDPTTRGHLYYRPPTGGEFYPFWLTD